MCAGDSVIIAGGYTKITPTHTYVKRETFPLFVNCSLPSLPGGSNGPNTLVQNVDSQGRQTVSINLNLEPSPKSRSLEISFV